MDTLFFFFFFFYFFLQTHRLFVLARVFLDGHLNSTSAQWSLKIAAFAQILLWCWFLLLCFYNLHGGLWAVTIYFVSVGSSLLLASVLFPGLQLEKKIRCFGYGEKILKIIMAIIPFFPLGIALVESALESSSSGGGGGG